MNAFCRESGGCDGRYEWGVLGEQDAGHARRARAARGSCRRGRADAAAANGFNADRVLSVLDTLAHSQAVMRSTNEIMSVAFFGSALLIWAVPKPTRKVKMGAAH
jgi:hypothetical protein